MCARSKNVSSAVVERGIAHCVRCRRRRRRRESSRLRADPPPGRRPPGKPERAYVHCPAIDRGLSEFVWPTSPIVDYTSGLTGTAKSRRFLIPPEVPYRRWSSGRPSHPISIDRIYSVHPGLFSHAARPKEYAPIRWLTTCPDQARLAARRQARAEAREIRMRELERQQKEAEENADRVYDMCTADVNRTMRVTPDPVRTSRLLTNSNNFQSSRRSSEDSLEDAGLSRDIRLELKEFEEKFRKAMIANAQLDNEKSSYAYQVDLLKDKLEELEETTAQLRRELREKNRDVEQLKRVSQRLKEDLDFCRTQLYDRDELIKENGLVIVEYVSEDDDYENTENGPCHPRRVLVSTEAAELLETAGKGSLDVRLRKFASEKKELQDEIRHLRLELEETRSRVRSERSSGSVLGCLSDNDDIQREANKLLADYKFKLQKAEQDMSTLQATVARLESQVIRYKSAAEASEKAEDELKVEKRKLQREVRETQGRVEELETANSHLQRRLDKLKNAKSALLKEL